MMSLNVVLKLTEQSTDPSAKTHKYADLLGTSESVDDSSPFLLLQQINYPHSKNVEIWLKYTKILQV